MTDHRVSHAIGDSRYRDAAGDYRWRAIDTSNGKTRGNILADSGQGYADERDRDRGIIAAAVALVELAKNSGLDTGPIHEALINGELERT